MHWYIYLSVICLNTAFYKNSNRNFYNKLKRIIKKDVYKYFNFSIDNADIEEFIFEFVFSSLINSYVYWYNHKNIMSLKSFVEFANNVISNGINIVLKNTHKQKGKHNLSFAILI